MNSFDLENRIHHETWPALRDDLLTGASDLHAWRGVANAEWCVLTSLDRFMADNFITDRLRVANRLLALFKRELEALGEQVPRNDHMVWALGQHYGLPTPLLDWTRSPLVAAYFSLTSADPKVPPADRVACIYRLEYTSSVFNDDGDYSVREAPAGPWNIRLRGQLGLFSESSVGGCMLEGLRARGYESRIQAYTFPFTVAEQAVADLRTMTIDDLHLFPDMDGIVRQVRSTVVREAQDGI